MRLSLIPTTGLNMCGKARGLLTSYQMVSIAAALQVDSGQTVGTSST